MNDTPSNNNEEPTFSFDEYIKSQMDMQLKPPIYKGKITPDLTPFADALSTLDDTRYDQLHALIFEATVNDLREHLNTGKLTSEQLLLYYVRRIQRYDVNRLNSIITLNPDALDIARQCDEDRANGNASGRLHGIPVLLKDNIATHDKMPNTAGAVALYDAMPDADAFIVQKLREAGAVILGKANLSEWANFMSNPSANGFSVLGGQTHNPYGDYDAGGSSSGSAVASSANLTAIAIGTETTGSLTYPASMNSVVTIKPSLGLVSRDRIIPITDGMDTAGPLTRTVSDCAELLTVIAGVDPNDKDAEATRAIADTDFTQALDKDALKGVRVALIQRADNDNFRREDPQMLRNALEGLKRAGAVVTITEPIKTPENVSKAHLEALYTGIRLGVDAYLQQTGHPTFKTLADIVRFNGDDMPNRAPYEQARLDIAVGLERDDKTLQAYVDNLRLVQHYAREQIETILTSHDCEVIVDLMNYSSTTWAGGGCPAVTLPVGYHADGTPCGVTFFGRFLDDAKMLSFAYAFEQATHFRTPPDLG